MAQGRRKTMDPITIGLAFTAAQTAIDGIKKAIALGKEARDVYSEISTFFNSQGEIKAAELELKTASITSTDKPKQRSATQEALDATFKSREMYRMEVELREMLIYQFNDSGLYTEMCQRRDAIVEEREEAFKEAQRIERMRLREIARKKQKRIDLIYDVSTITVGAILCGLIVYGITWMILYYRY